MVAAVSVYSSPELDPQEVDLRTPIAEMSDITPEEMRSPDHRKDASHKATTDLVQRHGLIGVEALHVLAKNASARGTAEDPGVDVRPKAGLNRRMFDVAPDGIRRQLEYKAAGTGRITIAFPASHTSQDRSACGARGHVERGERTFAFEDCGAVIERDTNAARNIRAWAIAEHSRRTGGDSP